MMPLTLPGTDVSTRMLSFVALLSAYASISLYLANDRVDIALYGLPIVAMTVVAALPRWNSPLTNTLSGIGVFVLSCALCVPDWTPMTPILVSAQLIMIALYGLSLVENRHSRVGRHPNEAESGGSAPLSRDVARGIVARELRRSRRTGMPLSLLLLRRTGELEPPAYRELAGFLKLRAREFDTVFAASADELGILCVDTDRTGAHHYAERIRTTTSLSDFSIASFPDDAVTLQGLFDAVKRGSGGGEEGIVPRTEGTAVVAE